MTLPFDSCRLYFYLRDKACAGVAGEDVPERGNRIVVDFASDHGEAATLGLTADEAHRALDQLYRSELVGRLASDQRDTWDRAHPGLHDDVVYIRPIDDLTATTVLFCCS